MGGKPIRGNEWLSTPGHSACYTCQVKMRISFERMKMTPVQPILLFLFSSSLFSLNLGCCIVKGLYMVAVSLYSLFGRAVITIKLYEDTCHLRHVLCLLPNAFATSRPGAEPIILL